MGLTITLLGDVTIRRTAGEPGPATRFDGTPQVRMAFAMLALGRHQGVTRDALAEALWPEGLPPSWRSSLRTVVSRVRAFVAGAVGDGDDGDEGDLLATRGGTYLLRLPGDTTVDLEVAESQVTMAAEALSQGQHAGAYGLALEATERLRASFLPEHHGEWIEVRRTHQTQMLLVGLELASEAASALGDDAGAIAAAAETIDRAPLRETAHRCLMAAHAAAGNRAEAVHAYQRLRRMLAEELGVDPDEETEMAYIGLLGPAVPAVDTGRGGRTIAQLGESVPFVGRDRAMAEAVAAWDHVVATTTSRLVLVTGETGVGKTRFATEFAKSLVGEGPMVLFGRCDPDAMIPYQPFVETLDALVAMTFHEHAVALSSSACAELAAVFPSFAGSAPAHRSGNRSVLFDAVTRSVKGVAVDHPVLIVLDDCQWADADSSLLLRHLLRHARATRLMVMAIVDGNPLADHPFAETVRALSRDGRVTHLGLDGLDDVACRTLVRELRPEARDLLAAAPRLVADTSGNPFLLIESIRVHEDGHDDGHEHDDLVASQVPGPVSPELDTFVTRRLETLDRSSQALLAAAAVAGSHFELGVASEAAELGRAEALDALEGALASGLVVDISSDDLGRSYRFTHDIVRRTLYHRLSPARRRSLHERVADAIEDAHGSAAASHVLLLAHHRCTAAEPHGDVRAVRWALAAAADAHAAAAPTEAVRWYRRALGHVAPGDVALRAEVLTELGLAQAQLDDDEGPATLFDAALRARSCGRSDIAARAVLALADLAREQPDLRQDAVALIDEALVSDPSDPSADGSRLPRVAWARLVARQLELQCGLSDGPSDGDCTRAVTAAGMLRRELRNLEGPDHLDDRRGLADDLRIAADATQDLRTQVAAHHHRAMVAAISGDGPTKDDSLRRMATALEAGGDPSSAPFLDERAITTAVVEGRFAELAHIATTPATMSGTDGPAPGAMARHQLVVAQWLQGDLHKARVDSPPDHDEVTQLVPAEQALIDLASGDHGASHIAVQELATGTRPLPTGDLWLHAVGLVGLAAVDLDDPAVASAMYGLLSPYAGLVCGLGYRSFVGTAAFHLGRLAMVIGQWADAERHLVLALHQLAAMRALPWVALAQDALARVLVARGRSSDHESLVALRSEARWLARTLGLRTASGLA